MASQDIEVRAQRIVAERFLDRMKSYPEELQEPIKLAYGQTIAQNLLDDILANDPILRDEIEALTSAEEELTQAYSSDDPYRQMLATWFSGEVKLINQVFVPLPELPGDAQMPDEHDQVPIEINRVHAKRDGWDIVQLAYPQEEPPEHVIYDVIMEFRYVRAAHRFLEVLRALRQLDPEKDSEVVAKLRRINADGDLSDTELISILRGWYEIAYDDSNADTVFVAVINEDAGKRLLSDLAVAFDTIFANYAESL